MSTPGAPGENPADIAARTEALRKNAESGVKLRDEFGETIHTMNAAGVEAQKEPEKAPDKIAKAVKGIADFFNNLGQSLVKIFGAEQMRKFAAGLKQGDWIRTWLESLLDSDGVLAKNISQTFPKIGELNLEDPITKEHLNALRLQVKEVADKTGKPRYFEEHIVSIASKIKKEPEAYPNLDLATIVAAGEAVVTGTEGKVETPTTDLFGVKGLKADNVPVTVPVATSEALTIKGKDDLAKISSKRITVLPSNKEFDLLFKNKANEMIDPKEMTISTTDALDARELNVTLLFENKITFKLKTIVEAAAKITGDGKDPVEISGTGVYLKPVKAPVA